MAKKNKAALQRDAAIKLHGGPYTVANMIGEVLTDLTDSVVINDGSEAALTAKDAAVVDATYGTEESGVIANNRTRIEELETALKNKGVLPA